MGLTQHKNAVANIQEIVNLMLLRGQIGKPGAGLCPVRGHSNVQGDRTMGIWERPTDAFLDKLGTEFNFEPPRRHGFDTVKAISGDARRQAKCFLRARRKFSFRDAGHGIHGRGPAALSTDGARFDETQSRAFDHGRAGVDSAVSRSNGN